MKLVMSKPSLPTSTPGFYPPITQKVAAAPKESMRGSSNRVPPAAKHTGRGFSKKAK